MAIGPTTDNLARRRAEEASLLDALVAQETAAQRAAMQPFASRPMSRDAASGTLASIAALEAAQARGELGPIEARSLAEMRLLAPLARATMDAQPNYTEMPSNALRGLLDIALTADMTVDDALRYYLGPTGIPDRLASLTQMADPGVYDAGYSAADLIDPRTSPEERRMAGQTVATTVAMAPLAFVGADDWARASLPDVGLGAATQRARERVGEFMADETGAIPLPKRLRGLLDPEAKLIGQHNLSPEGVRVSSEIGGIPMPSMAIARADAPLTNFGDVTLLAEPGMVMPSRDVNVWPNDAYTGRQPKGDVQFANEDAARRALTSDPQFGHMRDAGYWMDAANNFADADQMMRTAQLGASAGIDPSRYSSMWDYVSDVRAKLGYSAYEDAAQMPGFAAYGDLERVLYPKDLFTPSGNRRKPQPYTLDAVMKRMGSEKAYTAGSEGWDYGPGSFRAAVTPQFQTAEEVKAARGQILPRAQFATAANDFRDEYGKVRAYLEQFARDQRTVYETPEAMAEMGRYGRANWFGDVPPEARARVGELARTARTMPTEYFEAKPKVAYSLGDFPAAIVPESSPETVDLLRNAGVRDILTYGTQEERSALVRRFPQLMFSVAGAGAPLGLLATQPAPEQY